MKKTPKQRIRELVKELPDSVVDPRLASGISNAITDTVIKISEQIAQDRVNKIIENITVKPTISMGDIKVPAIKMPPINVPAARVQVDMSDIMPAIKMEPVNVNIDTASKWNFTINRLDNGLIDTITAERME